MASDALTNRVLWIDFLREVVPPVLTSLSQMPIVQHQDAGREASSQAEALSRVLAGIAPWLNAPIDDPAEAGEKEFFMGSAVEALILFFVAQKACQQSVIDAGYFCQAFLRCPKLWQRLPQPTQLRFTRWVKQAQAFLPIANNWIVMAALSEAFLYSIDKRFDPMRIDYALRALDGWYKGDGVYGDGKFLQNDYYNSIVIHPGLLDILDAVKGYNEEWDAFYPRVLKRAARYSVVQERMISPEGTYPIVGRSAMYKLGCFHSLAHSVYLGYYPGSRPAVQYALTQALNTQRGTLMQGHWLSMGFMGGKWLELAETYVSTGSLYAICLVLPILAIPESDPFWSADFEGWTQYNAWAGLSVNRDTCIDYEKE